MSYILDALKKADSERQHGKMPDIYSHQAHNDILEKEDSGWNKPIVWFLAALIVLLAASLVFINVYRTAPAVTLTAAQIAPSAPPVTANSPAVATTPVQNTPSSTVVQAAPAVVPAMAPATPPTPPIAAVESPPPAVTAPAEPVKLQASPKLSVPVAKEKHEKYEKRHASASASATEKKASATKDSDLAVETVSTTFRDLPLNIQNEIPTVTVGGYIYSANRADCQLLINKSLLHEGEQVAPGLTLERMMPHSAILNYKGYRYRISY